VWQSQCKYLWPYCQFDISIIYSLLAVVFHGKAHVCVCVVSRKTMTLILCDLLAIDVHIDESTWMVVPVLSAYWPRQQPVAA